MPTERGKELRRRWTRRKNVAKLRRRYAAAKSEAERGALLEKLAKVAPGLTMKQFLSPGPVDNGR